MGDEQITRNAMDVRESVDELVSGILDAGREVRVELDAVARLQRGVLEHGRAALRARAERADPLAQLDGGGAMAQSEADQAMHA
jgi:hypothetical protein